MGEFAGVELADLVLSGPRLTLRPWHAGDAEAVFAAISVPGAYPYIALPDPYTREDAQRFVTSLGDEGRASGTGIGCALVETATGRLVGSAALRLPGSGEIGYLIYPHARGNGYAAEATRVLTEWAFAHGVPRVQLFSHVGNLPSIRTAMNAGFTFEGISRSVSLTPIDPGGRAQRADMARFCSVFGDSGEPVAPAFPPLPRDGLADEVIALRCMQPPDLEPLLETDDALTMRWALYAEPHTRERAQRVTDEAGLEWLVGRIGSLAIVDVASGRFAGAMRIRLSGPPDVCALGYVVHPDFRGRGYTTRALRLVARWAFATGIARLELGAKVDNLASLKAASNAGFAYEGSFTARLRNADGSYSDEARYALINPAVNAPLDPSR